MKNRILLRWQSISFGLFLIICLMQVCINQINAQDSLWQRKYEFGIYNNHDLRNTSQNGISAHRLLNDAFNEGFAEKMKPRLASISKGIFSFSTTYLTMLWTHEFGHYIRAKQIGGQFNIHNFGLPVPYTTVDLPENISLSNEAIFVTAGFEVNYLNVRSLQNEFVRQNGNWNGDLALGFANRMMYPIYSTLITPRDPEDPNTWIETAGDPVHYILPVFKNYSDDMVFLQDGTVNPDLVSFYNQSSLFAMFFNLLDPQFYREVGATFGKEKDRRPIFILGDHEKGWTYGTLFNASPLGYELYLTNYIHFNGEQYRVYFKYGRPFKNLGIGFSMNDVIDFKNFKSDVHLELWQQDLFGNGISLETNARYKISEKIGLQLNLGYKTKGYVLGKQLDAGLNLGIGLIYYKN